ncbi:MAG: putative endopeptidase [Actinomycetota bacterium]|nr:putative endopeptidase [Actinomycetota bacterium]
MMISGIDLTALSDDIRPQDDLFRHVNGRWLDSDPIPQDRAAYGPFHELQDTVLDNLRAILDSQEDPGRNEAARAELSALKNLYASVLDEERIRRAGLSPLAGLLDKVETTTDPSQVMALLGLLRRNGLDGAFSLYVSPDAKDSGRYALYLNQSGLGLPDEAYYREETHAEVLDEYRGHVERLFRLAGRPDPAGAAGRVLALETSLAAGHRDRTAARDVQRAYNPADRQELHRLAPGIDWGAWTEHLQGPEGLLDRVIVRQPEYLTTLSQALVPQELPAWRDWLALQVIGGCAELLPQDFVDEDFAFHGKVLTGAQELRPRWKRGIAFTESAMGEALGRIYVERHFPPEAKQRMTELVANLIEAYRRSIADLDWMGPETRSRALAKLERFTPKIGYPERWRDYGALEADPTDLVGNAFRAGAFELDHELGKLAGPVDRLEWLMTPQTVNAYYHPTMNEIVFPAAVLQPPFFQLAADDAVNYGAIGAVIGHEIGHGFDDQGSRFDGDGNLQDWWESEDREEFERRAAALTAQYDELEPQELPGQRVNGSLTLGENIGDLGGLTIAHRAYHIALGDDEAPVIDGLTGDRRFFLSWAQAWRSAVRPEALAQRLAVDPHSPAEFRCNQVIRNMPEFHEAFGLGPQDGLWAEPQEQVHIW